MSMAALCLRVLFVAMTAMAMLLPSGSIFGVNVKMLAAGFIASLLALVTLIRGRVSRIWLYSWAILIGLVSYGVLIAELSGFHHHDSVQSQVIALLSVGSVALLLAGIPICGVLSTEKALGVVAIVAVIYAAAKVALEIVMLLGSWTLEEVVAAVTVVFGVGFIRLDAGGLLRINFPADFVLPPVLMYLLAGWGRGPWRGGRRLLRTVAAGLVLASLAIAYSRYLWFVTLALLSYWFLITSRRMSVYHVLVLAVTVLASTLLGPMVIERFTGEAAGVSDAPRALMFELIAGQIEASPIVGSGMGYYFEHFVRIPKLPWYYELQWLALLMQLGFIGFSVAAGVCLTLLPPRSLAPRAVGVSVAYLSWLASGLINGFLLTSSAGVVFLTYWLMVRNEQLYERPPSTSGVLSSAVPSD